MKRLTALALTLLFATSVVAVAIERDEIPDEYKWKTEHIYESVEAMQADFEAVQEMVDELASFKGKFVAAESTEELAELMVQVNELSKQTSIKMSRVGTYIVRNYHVNMGEPKWGGLLQQVQNVSVSFGQKLAWVEPEMIAVGEQTMLAAIEEREELAPYRKGIEDLFALQSHVLAEDKEQLLAQVGRIAGSAGSVRSKFVDVDLSFEPITGPEGEEIEVSNAGWTSWRTDPNREVREAYFKSLWAGFDEFNTTLAELMNSNLQEDVFYANVRNYESTLDASLKPNFIPTDVYHNLVNTTRANVDVLHKYNEIRKRMLGVEHYRHWDYYVPLTQSPDLRYTWEEGVEMVVEGLEPMGEEYLAMVQTALDADNGWVDPFASKGKRGGAYSGGLYGIHPYMLYNFDYEKGLTRNDVSTMAHEVGHALHSWFSEKNQPYALKDYAIFNAEVASTTNETLMAMKLLDEARTNYKKAKKKDKEAAKMQLVDLLVENIDKARGTFFRQTMFATWELEAHKMAENNQPITGESLNKIYGDLLAEFHGPAAEYEEISSVTWSRIPHYYRGYYVYAYATSYASAVALATDIRAEASGDKKASGSAERYLDYVSSGSSKHPVELLKDAGVDMTTPAPIESFVSYVRALVTELDELTKA